MKFLWSLLAFVFLPTFTMAVVEINDTNIYKPCIMDSTTCPYDQVCFQYFCYPKVASAKDPLKSCKKNSQCPGWKPKTEKCWKTGRNGVCIPSEDYESCEVHEECEGRGGKCCGDYCCNTEYFNTLLKAPCNDETCKVKRGFVLDDLNFDHRCKIALQKIDKNIIWPLQKGQRSSIMIGRMN